MKQYKRGSLIYDKLHDSYRAFVMINGRRYSKRFKKKDDAMDWMSRQKIAERDGNFVAPSDMLVGQWLLYFLSTYKRILSEPVHTNDISILPQRLSLFQKSLSSPVLYLMYKNC